jgi:hypothetical protein
LNGKVSNASFVASDDDNMVEHQPKNIVKIKLAQRNDG